MCRHCDRELTSADQRVLHASRHQRRAQVMRSTIRHRALWTSAMCATRHSLTGPRQRARHLLGEMGPGDKHRDNRGEQSASRAIDFQRPPRGNAEAIAKSAARDQPGAKVKAIEVSKSLARLKRLGIADMCSSWPIDSAPEAQGSCARMNFAMRGAMSERKREPLKTP